MPDPTAGTPRTDSLTAREALRRSGFTEYRKKALTPISDITFPPGTTYQTPEGLRAEDEETRCAFDVQGGIYPIRESVFRASYELPEAEASGTGLDVFECRDCWRYITAHHPDRAALSPVPVPPEEADHA